MITILSGKIGSGKSHHTVREFIIPDLKEGRTIYTNIDGLKPRFIAQYLGNRGIEDRIVIVDNEMILALCQMVCKDGTGLGLPPNSTVIVDEAHDIWPAREFKKTTVPFLTFLSQSRHFGINCVFITQNTKQLEVAISRLATQFQDIENLGFFGGIAKNGYKVAYRRGLLDNPDYSTLYKYLIPIFSLYESSKVPEKSKAGKLPWQAKVAALSAFALLSLAGPKLAKNKYLHGRPPEIQAVLPLLDVSSAPVVAVPLTNVEKVLEAIKAHDKVMDSMITPDLDTELPPLHVVMHNGLSSKPKGYWRKEKDGSETYIH